MASLAPIGPIRLTPGATNQATTTTIKSNNNSKPPVIFTKGPKMIQTPTLSGKLKNTSTNRTLSKNVVNNNYNKNMNLSDKIGDLKLVTGFGSDGNQERIATSTSSGIKLKLL